jgi:hypothetical protein
MSLYESFSIAQHVSNAITFILRSRRLYVGVLLCFGVYWYIGAGDPVHSTPHAQTSSTPTCIRIPPYSSRTAPIHTETEHYTHIQLPAPEDECNSIRNMLSN